MNLSQAPLSCSSKFMLVRSDKSCDITPLPNYNLKYLINYVLRFTTENYLVNALIQAFQKSSDLFELGEKFLYI